MALKITNFELDRVEGVLDDALQFSMTRDGQAIVATIGTWSRQTNLEGPASAPMMRNTAYQMLASYREDSRISAVFT